MGRSTYQEYGYKEQDHLECIKVECLIRLVGIQKVIVARKHTISSFPTLVSLVCVTRVW